MAGNTAISIGASQIQGLARIPAASVVGRFGALWWGQMTLPLTGAEYPVKSPRRPALCRQLNLGPAAAGSKQCRWMVVDVDMGAQVRMALIFGLPPGNREDVAGAHGFRTKCVLWWYQYGEGLPGSA